ncbi:uncharacterized protein LOC122248470 isoform X3 [Penaeus japonicus]|uniref:uncharacterized protein LOC122248470 isoform X2 n=1 Tax=Penaeus japonicus TaxID=27405 RepID=UPI001C710361|nr:uncharacterized protein LOC122248470 isoform X2 [Penaeus japonicus]XP_042864421.1 uncharacterized protein LOC122248470 isoform X2 [Penaeus japonicus]XP_042864422.1 uncharacterized protein LOC122248470 isoform X3 [Penaeus japonicus]
MPSDLLSREQALSFLDKVGITDGEETLRKDPRRFLSDLLKAYQEHVPFQCVSLLAQSSEERHVPTLEEIVEAGLSLEGGLCFTLNTFFCLLLRALGFKVDVLDGSFSLSCHPHTHEVLLLRDLSEPGDNYIIDVGGGCPFLELIPVKDLPVTRYEAGFEYRYQYLGGMVARLHRIREDSERNQNETWPWAVYRTMLEEQDVRFSDFEATTESHPGLRFIFKFRRFWEWRDVDASDEVKILTEWAEGTQPVPDLLIAGYTSWMLYTIPQRLENDPNSPLDVLDLLMRVHEVVVPLLQRVAHRTRVLVHADTRLRPHSQAKKPGHRLAMNAVFQNFLEDWSEMMFRFFEKFGSGRITRRRRLVTRTVRLEGGLEHLVNMVEEITQGDRPSRGFDRMQSPPEEGAVKDYLRPDESGLWWWDTSLPINMATISECSDLHDRNFTQLPQYSEPVLRCEDHHHSGTATLNFEVHMLLNLICNTHLAVDRHFCCS